MKLKLFLVLFFAGAVSAHAQQAGTQRRTIEERVTSAVNKISDSLTLDATQKEKAKAAFTGYYTSMDKLREGGARPEKADRDKLISERDEQLKGAFTDEQYKKFKDVIEPSLKGNRGGDRPQTNN